MRINRKLKVILMRNAFCRGVREPRPTAEDIVNLALQIESDAPETNLAISGLIVRADDKEISSVNKFSRNSAARITGILSDITLHYLNSLKSGRITSVSVRICPSSTELL